MATIKSSSDKAKSTIFHRYGVGSITSRLNSSSSSDKAKESIKSERQSHGGFTRATKETRYGIGAAVKKVNSFLADPITSQVTGITQRVVGRSMLFINRSLSTKEKDPYAQAATKGVELPGSSYFGRVGSGKLPDTDPNKDINGSRRHAVGDQVLYSYKSSPDVSVNRSLSEKLNHKVESDRSSKLSESEKFHLPPQLINYQTNRFKSVLINSRGGRRLRNGDKTHTYVSRLGKTTTNFNNLNRVLIINTNAEKPENPSGHIYLQVRPCVLEIDTKTDFAQVKSMGRNVPMYHYCGGERVLRLDTSWYMKGKPEDPGFDPYFVIRQCRTLEAWSMANGYLAAPPILAIDWGDSPIDDTEIPNIFAGSFWILHSATYNLKDFHSISGGWSKTGFELSNDITYLKFEDYGLLPFSATQELVFHQVSNTNLSHSDIINLPNLKV